MNIQNVDVLIKETGISIACSEKNSFSIHIFDWNLKDLQSTNHQIFQLKELNDFFNNELLIKQIKFINENELIIKTNLSLEKWKRNEKWNFITSLNHKGKIEISKEKIYLFSKESIEILSKETLEIEFKDEFINTNNIVISPNEICFVSFERSTISLFCRTGSEIFF